MPKYLPTFIDTVPADATEDYVYLIRDAMLKNYFTGKLVKDESVVCFCDALLYDMPAEELTDIAKSFGVILRGEKASSELLVKIAEKKKDLGEPLNALRKNYTPEAIHQLFNRRGVFSKKLLSDLLLSESPYDKNNRLLEQLQIEGVLSPIDRILLDQPRIDEYYAQPMDVFLRFLETHRQREATLAIQYPKYVKMTYDQLADYLVEGAVKDTARMTRVRAKNPEAEMIEIYNSLFPDRLSLLENITPPQIEVGKRTKDRETSLTQLADDKYEVSYLPTFISSKTRNLFLHLAKVWNLGAGSREPVVVFETGLSETELISHALEGKLVRRDLCEASEVFYTVLLNLAKSPPFTHMAGNYNKPLPLADYMTLHKVGVFLLRRLACMMGFFVSRTRYLDLENLVYLVSRKAYSPQILALEIPLELTVAEQKKFGTGKKDGGIFNLQKLLAEYDWFFIRSEQYAELEAFFTTFFGGSPEDIFPGVLYACYVTAVNEEIKDKKGAGGKMVNRLIEDLIYPNRMVELYQSYQMVPSKFLPFETGMMRSFSAYLPVLLRNSKNVDLNVGTLATQLRQMTDYEILRHVKAQPFYFDRSQMIEQILQLKDSPDFVIPLNQCTEPLAYGTLGNFSCTLPETRSLSRDYLETGESIEIFEKLSAEPELKKFFQQVYKLTDDMLVNENYDFSAVLDLYEQSPLRDSLALLSLLTEFQAGLSYSDFMRFLRSDLFNPNMMANYLYLSGSTYLKKLQQKTPRLKWRIY